MESASSKKHQSIKLQLLNGTQLNEWKSRITNVKNIVHDFGLDKCKPQVKRMSCHEPAFRIPQRNIKIHD